MSAEELLDQGRLEECLESLQSEVRRAPAVARHRMFLFQVFSLLGQWDRALTQLNIAVDLDASMTMAAAMYRPALASEPFREQVFAGKRTPTIFGEPEEWVALLVQANQALASGNATQAEELRRKAMQSARPSEGTINGKPFRFVMDADSRMGPVFEALVEGSYYWVPFSRLKSIEVSEPTDAQDLVWAPTIFTWTNGGQMGGLIPTRYPGSHTAADNAIRMSRKTEWQQPGGNFHTGLGQRLLATDADAYPLLAIRNLTFATAAAPAATQGAA
jgi:type VI secretion system protein ImpE